jgi:hypothetical protein
MQFDDTCGVVGDAGPRLGDPEFGAGAAARIERELDVDRSRSPPPAVA